MKKAISLITVALAFSIHAPAVRADLDNPVYATALEAYEGDDCYQALSLLKKYRKEDGAFLDGNPRIEAAVTGAIDYCDAILFQSRPGTSYPTGPPQKPPLPASKAHLFDSRERLRVVIEELRSGNADLDRMEPMLRISMRRRQADYSKRIKGLGALQSITFEGEQNGADVYEVRFENGTTAWMIAIAADGRIATLVFHGLER